MSRASFPLVVRKNASTGQRFVYRFRIYSTVKSAFVHRKARNVFGFPKEFSGYVRMFGSSGNSHLASSGNHQFWPNGNRNNPDMYIRFLRSRLLGGIRSFHPAGLQSHSFQLLSSETLALNGEHCSNRLRVVFSKIIADFCERFYPCRLRCFSSPLCLQLSGVLHCLFSSFP